MSTTMYPLYIVIRKTHRFKNKQQPQILTTAVIAVIIR
jgi:hypothetical protein